MSHPEQHDPDAEMAALLRARDRGIERRRALDAPCRRCGHGYGAHALSGCHDCVHDEQHCAAFLGRQDWGHGPRTPEPMWTEDDLRTAMLAVMHSMGDVAKIEAVIARLKDDVA